jgi:ATP-dependent Clp protease protease subunit
MTKNWYTITNKGEAEAEVCIYDEIGMWGITAKDFLTELKSVGNRKIVLRINSPGGEVFDGLAIYNRLREHAPGVEVRIDGIAASMASVIAMVGAPIKMAENALLMIHNPSGVCMGDAEDMRELADMLDKVRGSLTGAYERKTGKTAEEITALMNAETWLNAEEAKEGGFCDEITGAMKLAAKFDKLAVEGKLMEREKEIDLSEELRHKPALSMEALDTAKTPAELELERIEAQRVVDAKAKADKEIADNATLAERKRVSDIQEWSGEVGKLRNKDFSELVALHVKEGKSLIEFKEAVLKAEFTAPPLATATDTNGADGKTMKREDFTKLSPFNQKDFCLKGGVITD